MMQIAHMPTPSRVSSRWIVTGSSAEWIVTTASACDHFLTPS